MRIRDWSADVCSSDLKENRTPYLFHAMEALYQLSYSPVGSALRGVERTSRVRQRRKSSAAAARNRNRAPGGASVRCPDMAADTARDDVADGRVPDYDPQAVEAKWPQRWLDEGTSDVENDAPRPKFHVQDGRACVWARGGQYV